MAAGEDRASRIWETSAPPGKLDHGEVVTGGPPTDLLPKAVLPPVGSDPKDLVLYGQIWTGKDKDGRDVVRLDTTCLLDDYTDLADVKIKYRRKVPFDGGTRVCVGRDELITCGRGTQDSSTQASFLGGQIAATWLRGAPAEGWSDSGQGVIPPETVLCRSCPGCC